MRSLLADIGGTYARLAVLGDGELGPIQRLDVNAFPGIGAALRSFLEGPGGAQAIDAAILAVAGPVSRSLTIETGDADRVANMRVFSGRLLTLLVECLEAA